MDRALSGILHGSRTLPGTYRYRRAAFARARKSLDRIRPGTELLRFSMERVAKTFLCLCRWQFVRTEANDGDEPLTAVPTEFRMQKWRRIRRSLAA